jgi:DnaA family protein
MKQLILDIARHPSPSFANFVVGRNAEVLAALTALADGRPPERFVYLWGEPGSGRSHLLAATVARAASAKRAAFLLPAPLSRDALDAAASDALVVLDDIEILDAAGERGLFGLYNRIRADGGSLLVSGPLAPKGLAVRADLATRLSWGLVFEVRALTDADKAQAMRERALAHGFSLPNDVCVYALRHARRDLPSLLDLVDRLDRYSIATHRAVTLPLLRELMSEGSGSPRPA